MSRLPIRYKLTLAFAAAMTAVLIGAGVLLMERFEQQLDATIEADLRLQAGDVAALVATARRGRDPLVVHGSPGRPVQVLDLRNRVVAASAGARARSLLTARELADVTARELRLRRGSNDGLLLIARRAGPDRVVVVGTGLERRAEARSALVRVVLLAGPVVLLVAVLAGYAVVLFALRPVEAIRRRAEEVSAAGRGQRVPVPAARDELGALGRTLNAMIERLERALDRERTLVADASHELRTPLAIAQAEVELALRPGAPPEEMEDALRSVGEEIERLVRLCDDLLVLARADRHALQLEQRRVRVPVLLAELGERARRTYGIALTVAAGEDTDVAVEVDPLRIEQAVSNLVVNAARYGATHVRIWSSREGAATVRLHVSDDGPGFPAEFLPDAFSRFARGADSPPGDGAGLGLAIVEAIATAHGGTAGAGNVSPHGADVWIELPATGIRVATGAGPAEIPAR